MIVFDNAKQELEDAIEDIEGNDIMENMLQERREWIQEQKAMANGKVPADIAKFYERNNLEQPLSPEEEEAKKAAEEAEKGKKGKDKKKETFKKYGKNTTRGLRHKLEQQLKENPPLPDREVV